MTTPITTTDPAATGARLSRTTAPGHPAAPVRVVHLGLGNFFRAHQAWYTDQANRADSADRGASPPSPAGRPRSRRRSSRRTGSTRSSTRGADGDLFDVVGSVAAVHRSDDHAAWLGYWASPDVVVVTLTVTEAGYLRGPDGRLDAGREDVRADVAALRSDPSAPVRTTPGRLVAGLLARRAAGAGCADDRPVRQPPGERAGAGRGRRRPRRGRRPDPGRLGRRARRVRHHDGRPDHPGHDRRAPRPRAGATGLEDAAPVPTEPFSEWVIQGTFAAGRPAWDAAGAHVVADVEPFEQRKLWLLNGAHSLLAYAGTVRGHETVADAIADPVLRGWVEEWWDGGARPTSPCPPTTSPPTGPPCSTGSANPAIRHALAQIAADGSQKLPVRILPTLRAELAAGRVPTGATRVIAAWVLHLRGTGAPVKDVRADDVLALVTGTPAEAVQRVIACLAPDLADHDGLRDAVVAQLDQLGA